jgi:DNA-binding transcriptional LysR family regulator
VKAKGIDQLADRLVARLGSGPEGMLRVTVPVILGQEPFLEFVSGFSKHHPEIRIELFITNLFLDLVTENMDVAGPVTSS